MSAGKLTWGRRDWLGLMALFLSSIAADVIGALLAVKGILPMGERGCVDLWRLGAGRISGRAGGGAGAQRHRAGFAAAGGRGLCVDLAGGSDGVRYGGLCPSRSGDHAGGGGWCAAGSRAGAGETASEKEACSAGTATSRDDIECSIVKITKISLGDIFCLTGHDGGSG